MTTLNLVPLDQTNTGLKLIGNPRQYRADCKLGKFKIGAGQVLDKTLIMEVIAVQIIEDELFGYDFQKWLDVIFADEQGIVSSIMFKTESMDNFLELYRQTIADKKDLSTVQLIASMSPRAGEYGNFYALEFDIGEAGKLAEEIQEFREHLPSGIFRHVENGNRKEKERKAVHDKPYETIEREENYAH